MRSPFIQLLGMRFDEVRPGFSRTTLGISDDHFNTHGVVHGGVAYSVADTGMGAALYPLLDAGEQCATIEIKINYFRPVLGGELVCDCRVLHRGRTVANIDAELRVGTELVAKANGSFAIFAKRPRPVDQA